MDPTPPPDDRFAGIPRMNDYLGKRLSDPVFRAVAQPRLLKATDPRDWRLCADVERVLKDDDWGIIPRVRGPRLAEAGPAPAGDRVIAAAECAARLGVSIEMLEDLTRDAGLPTAGAGLAGYRWPDVLAWALARQNPPEQGGPHANEESP